MLQHHTTYSMTAERPSRALRQVSLSCVAFHTTYYNNNKLQHRQCTGNQRSRVREGMHVAGLKLNFFFFFCNCLCSALILALILSFSSFKYNKRENCLCLILLLIRFCNSSFYKVIKSGRSLVYTFSVAGLGALSSSLF